MVCVCALCLLCLHALFLMYSVVVYGVYVFVGVLVFLVCEYLWVVASMRLCVLFVIVWYCMFYVC